MGAPYPRLDIQGAKLREGDAVRLVGLPDLSDLPVKDPLHTREVFQHLRGTVKRIRAFNSYGFAEFDFSILRGPFAGYHSVCVEPWLLLRQRGGHES